MSMTLANFGNQNQSDVASDAPGPTGAFNPDVVVATPGPVATTVKPGTPFANTGKAALNDYGNTQNG